MNLTEIMTTNCPHGSWYLSDKQTMCGYCNEPAWALATKLRTELAVAQARIDVVRDAYKALVARGGGVFSYGEMARIGDAVDPIMSKDDAKGDTDGP
jgi:hypothetical protein